MNTYTGRATCRHCGGTITATSVRNQQQANINAEQERDEHEKTCAARSKK